MKKTALILSVFLLAGGFTGCKKINEATEFSMNYSTAISMPAANIPVSGTADFFSPEIATNSSDKFKSEGTTSDLIGEIKMTQFKITASTGNLDFLKAISVYISAPGLSDVLVATKSNIPPGSTFVDTDVTGANIKEFIFKEKIRFRATVTFNSGVTEDKEILLDQTVLVSGKKL